MERTALVKNLRAPLDQAKGSSRPTSCIPTRCLGKAHKPKMKAVAFSWLLPSCFRRYTVPEHGGSTEPLQRIASNILNPSSINWSNPLLKPTKPMVFTTFTAISRSGEGKDSTPRPGFHYI